MSGKDEEKPKDGKAEEGGWKTILMKNNKPAAKPDFSKKKPKSSSNANPPQEGKPFYKPGIPEPPLSKTKADASEEESILCEYTKNKREKNNSLEMQSIHRLASLIAKDPKKYLQQLRESAPHMIEEVLKWIPIDSVSAFYEMYKDDYWSKYCSYWNFVDLIERYEAEFLTTSRAGSSLAHLDKGLIDIYQNYDTFVLDPLTEEDKKRDKIFFSKYPPFRPPTSAIEKFHSVVSEADFKRRFNIFTNHQLEGWNDWNNMVVIGGSVVASLLKIPDNYAISDEKIAEFYHHVAYTQSDIDIYIYGLSEEDFNLKVMKLHKHLERTLQQEVLVVRTTFTLTFCTRFPNRHIQIVLGKWRNLQEVLFEPDIDCTCVAYNGDRVWATQRSRLSYNKKWIVASPERYKVRKFPEYESRLFKYSKRGFFIVDKKFHWNKISKYWMDVGRGRLLEHKVVKGRTGVNGLRLLLAAVRFPEVLEKVDLFQSTKWKDVELLYGPKYKQEDIKRVLKEPVFTNTHYGPYEVPNPYKIIHHLHKTTIKLSELHDDKTTEWRWSPNWYAHVFYADELKEIQEHKDDPYYRKY